MPHHRGFKTLSYLHHDASHEFPAVGTISPEPQSNQFEILHNSSKSEYPGLVSRESMTESPHRLALRPHSLALALADPHFLHPPPTVSTLSPTWANLRANCPRSNSQISRRTLTVRSILSPVAQPSELPTVDKKELQQWCLHTILSFKKSTEPDMS